jgi:pyruvate dehydrogenase E2 component (dihydrolipoamide acetyltransferase)
LKRVGNSEIASDAVETAKGSATTIELSRADRAVVRRAADARATVPDLELTAVADLSAWEPFQGPWASCPTAALVHAAAVALRAFPRANGAYRDGRFELYSRVNIAVVMPGPGEAQVAPTVFDADQHSRAEIEAMLIDLERRAVADELTPPELAGATFTVANFGARGIARAQVLPTPPQAAALAAGAIRAVPVLRADGLVAPGRTIELTLVSDHRILYGTRAAKVLELIVATLEQGGHV